jgi:D-alanine transaminase
LAQDEGVAIEERPFSLEEAYKAQEAFLTAASAFVLPVVTIDDHTIGTGQPGPIARAFRQYYIDEARASLV